MSAVSIGYFDPNYIVGNAAVMTKAIEKTFERKLIARPSFPLHVACIADSAVSYALFRGHVPIHRDPVGEHDVDGRIFQLVIGVRNRPVLLTAPDTAQNTMLIGRQKTMKMGVGIGAIELQAGMAVHFDITNTWHGTSGFPIAADEDFVDRSSGCGAKSMPMAVIIQVSGRDATDIEGAVEAARAMVTADVAVSNQKGR